MLLTVLLEKLPANVQHGLRTPPHSSQTDEVDLSVIAPCSSFDQVLRAISRILEIPDRQSTETGCTIDTWTRPGMDFMNHWTSGSRRWSVF